MTFMAQGTPSKYENELIITDLNRQAFHPHTDTDTFFAGTPCALRFAILQEEEGK